MKPFSLLYVFSLLVLTNCSSAQKKQATNKIPAFPGAEGFGSFAEGGRGGNVFFVTTLADYGKDEEPIEGSLRKAVEAEGPRTIVFRTGGLITLKRDLLVKNSHITIAGQTAPGGGICLKNYPLVIEADHVIIRHIRSRLGEDMHEELDAISVNMGNNIILDHCSASWSTDEVLSSYSEMATIQYCIIAEGLMHSRHPKGPHSMGSIIEGKTGGISLLNNIYAHNNSRNPLIQNKGEEPGAVVEIRNNIIYDWGAMPGYTSQPGNARINFLNNYLKPGPSTSSESRKYGFRPENEYTSIYVNGNFHTENTAGTTDNKLLLWSKLNDQPFLRKEQYAMFPYQAQEPGKVYDDVLNNAGATLPARDAVDTRIINDIRTGGGHIINSQNDVGGWPAYENGEAKPDGDNDGMPDEWESKYKLDAAKADNNDDADKDGYTNLEEYLNSTDPTKEDKATITYEEYTKVVAAKDALYAEDIKSVKKRLEAEKQERQNRVVPGYTATIVPDNNNRKLVLDGKPILNLKYIPAGTFTMGSPATEQGREEWEVQHQVTLSKPFYMAEVEMSNALIKEITGLKGYSDNKLPASISWFDAEWVCEVLSKKTGKKFRLPTEAEWEYACRAGTTTTYFSGSDITLAYANFNTGDPKQEKAPRPVDEGLPNAWGLKNMPGNQFEWCYDWKGLYSKDAVTDPQGPPQDKSIRSFDGLYRKIMRGGNYGSTREILRSAYRYDYSRDVKYGFRVLMEE